MTNMQVAALAGTLAVLVIALGVLVWRLHTEVRRLGAEVTDLRSREGWSRQARPPEGDRPVVSTVSTSSTPSSTASSSSDSTTEAVPLITGLAEDRPTDGVEPSTARMASVTLGPPLIKVAAFCYGVRRALSGDQRMHVSYAVRKELRRQQKVRRRRRRSPIVSQGGRP